MTRLTNSSASVSSGLTRPSFCTGRRFHSDQSKFGCGTAGFVSEDEAGQGVRRVDPRDEWSREKEPTQQEEPQTRRPSESCDGSLDRPFEEIGPHVEHQKDAEDNQSGTKILHRPARIVIDAEDRSHSVPCDLSGAM